MTYSKLYIMKSNLLPNSFKLIGAATFALAFLIPLVIGFFNPQTWEDTESRRQVAQTFMLLGLSAFILSKEKVEDEFINACRLKAFKVAFVAGIIYYLQDAFGTYNGALLNSSFYLLAMQIGVYCVIFYLLKSGLTNGK